MTRGIYFGVDLHGHVNPTLGLIRELTSRGEEILYYSGEPFRERIEAAGAAFTTYKEPLGFGTHDAGGIETFLVTADFILSRSQKIVSSLLEEVQAWAPDYIVHDAFCYWGKELALQLGVPGISVFANFAYIDEMADVDPEFFMEYVLRAGNDPVYAKNKGKTDVYRKLEAKLSKIIAMKYGVHTTSIINDIFCGKEKLNLAPTSREFQLYGQAFDDSYVFTGYAIEPRTEPDDFPFEWLDGRPLIYIALGTIFNDAEHIYTKCIEAFGDQEVQVAMSIGHQVPVERLGQLPDNVIVRPHMPQLALLSRAAAFVTHGGSNSIHESLCSEVPMVVVPQSFDQFMGAIAVEKAGTGIFLQGEDWQPAEVADAVRRVRTEPAYQEACGRIHRSLDEAGGPARAVDAIFAHVAAERGKALQP
ncbi:glycosyltransferase, MGT family [Paenibacillus curdlanolyticus YK9]|uniref:Glycosyltransferase, MGT family n=1 Tax=Paenibacillus curdlanolyticus YK9 TaxID=717606 RepID=E0IG98_9BACL|nr:macrolide family glycosyltransferase [Paenibacillus curdlanolyticus]EFM08500.1 glycosyltransferase, MGT family [Paenibacillus curdlanolyticus YK9]